MTQVNASSLLDLVKLFSSKSATANGNFQFKEDGEPANDDDDDNWEDDEDDVSSVDSERTQLLKEDFMQQVRKENEKKYLTTRCNIVATLINFIH